VGDLVKVPGAGNGVLSFVNESGWGMVVVLWGGRQTRKRVWTLTTELTPITLSDLSDEELVGILAQIVPPSLRTILEAYIDEAELELDWVRKALEKYAGAARPGIRDAVDRIRQIKNDINKVKEVLK